MRPIGNYGLSQWLYVSTGLLEEDATSIAALKATLTQEKAAT